MSRVIYLTHPQVIIDPDVPVPDWGLNEVGQQRVELIKNAPALKALTSVASSGERKAIETATPIAEVLGLPVHILQDTHENDRSATGFLPPSEFEETANAFFTSPDLSIRGWEKARDAQARIVSAVSSFIETAPEGDVLFTGHGGVGTLLYCALSGKSISRSQDQGAGGGYWFAFDRASQTPDGGWRPMESLLNG